MLMCRYHLDSISFCFTLNCTPHSTGASEGHNSPGHSHVKHVRRSLLHALRRLSGHVNAPHGVELGFGDVQMAVQAAAFTPLRDDSKVGLSHIAHEE